MSPKKSQIPIVKRSLFSWILADNAKLQVLLVVIILATVFARVLPLEMQKRIVNEAINLRKIDLLLIYCGIYLAAVVVAAGLKYLISILQTLISQRATANMRKALYHYILTLPLNFFRGTQPGMVVNALINELTIPGNFIGMAVAVPASNLLTLLGFAGYLFWLNPLLAAISLSIYPLVLLLVPLLQKKSNLTNKQRVDLARDLSSRIAETVSGIHEVQGNGAFRIEKRKFDLLVERLRRVRVIWSLYRFGVKTANNFFTSLGPFLVFILGGYLTIRGELELGALVAFLSAQEKLYDPWSELIEFYQVYQEGAVNYARTMQYFDFSPDFVLEPSERDPYDLTGSIEVANLSFATDDGIRLLDNISFALKQGEHLALVGFSGSGKSTLALCVGQLYKYTDGHALIGGQEVAELTKSDMIRNLGFVSQSPLIFSGSIQENLLYAWAALHGDHQPDGKLKEPTLDDMIAVLQQTGIFIDVLRFGLNTLITPGAHEQLVKAIIRIRARFQKQYGRELADWIEFFDDNIYLHYSSIAANLIFGTPRDESFADPHLIQNTHFLDFLTAAGLTRPLIALGADLTLQTVDILKILPPDEIFFEQSPIHPAEIETYKDLAEKLKRRPLDELSEAQQGSLLKVALRFTPGRHKMVALPALLEQSILKNRSQFMQRIAQLSPDAIHFYQKDDYIHSQTILNNILFGTTTTENPEAQEKINQSIIQLLIEEDFLESVVEIGMQFEVGSKGDRLSGGQRQKLAIARVLLKKPRILIMDEATSALDNNSQTRIQNFIELHLKGKSTLIAVVHRLDIIKNFDRIAVMRAGKIVEIGTYNELIDRKGVLYELQFGKK
jgi:ABC-type multidrug transport system fused ATPase/permease subunit